MTSDPPMIDLTGGTDFEFFPTGLGVGMGKVTMVLIGEEAGVNYTLGPNGMTTVQASLPFTDCAACTPHTHTVALADGRVDRIIPFVVMGCMLNSRNEVF